MAKGPHSRGGSFEIRRRGKARARRLPYIKLNDKASLAGWSARLENHKTLKGKFAQFRTSNPLLINREKGKRIYSKPGRAFRVRVRAKSGKVKKIFYFKGSVYIRPRLKARLIMRFHRFEMDARLRKNFDRAVQRFEKEQSRQAMRDSREIFSFAGNTLQRLVRAA